MPFDFTAFPLPSTASNIPAGRNHQSDWNGDHAGQWAGRRPPGRRDQRCAGAQSLYLAARWFRGNRELVEDHVEPQSHRQFGREDSNPGLVRHGLQYQRLLRKVRVPGSRELPLPLTVQGRSRRAVHEPRLHGDPGRQAGRRPDRVHFPGLEFAQGAWCAVAGLQPDQLAVPDADRLGSGGPTTSDGGTFIETYEKYGRQYLLGFNYKF